ncbi:hypothetical protein LWC33_34445, partial [Pseudonocardia sp. RS11V-5]|uniref:hypothetical protein n=1 Tax=Pseudonocardia terrae TaxID=2905831 RepID=UPI001E2E64BC
AFVCHDSPESARFTGGSRFSHADVLTVATSPRPGECHGRRLVKADVERDYSCDVLDPNRVAGELADHLALLDAVTGTVVRWSDTHFPRATGVGVEEWMERSRTLLRMHLGVIYHRLLAGGRVSIDIEVYDETSGESGAPETVVAIDPFGFSASAVTTYPKALIATIGDVRISLDCHIVPPKSSGPSFRLYGRDGAESQGFYIYRSDRLLQVGGWNDVISADRNRALARVVIDDFESLSTLVRMNPEKSGIAFRHELSAAITAATTGGAKAVSFGDYVARAEAVLVESRKRKHARRPIAKPSKGLHEEVRRIIRAEIPLREHEGPVEIRWRRMPRDKFLELDREERVIFLNQNYREMLTGGKTGLSDAPLLKTLVFLMTQEHFTGQYWGSKDRDLIDMWDSVLGAAVQTEYEYRTAGGER